MRRVGRVRGMGGGGGEGIVRRGASDGDGGEDIGTIH